MNMNELNQKTRVNFREVWYYKKYTFTPFAVKCKVYGKYKVYMETRDKNKS